jgi:alcohol dehydrogenase (cytochrome c)
MGGALATAGGLTFTGEGNGNFNAYDSRNGRLLWQFNGGAGCNSAPMSFSYKGEQFIAVACGGNFQLNFPLGNSVYVFGVPKPFAAAMAR